LKPALIMLAVFAVVIGGLTAFVATYKGPGTEDRMNVEPRDLFPELAAADVSRIELTGPKLGRRALVLERTGDLKWHIVEPLRALAAGEKMRRLLEAFVDLRSVDGFTTKDLFHYELDEPRYRMTVSTRDGRSMTVEFGVRVPDVAPAAARERMDPFTLRERGGSGQAIAERYARVGGRNEVLIVPDSICPLIDAPPPSFREAALVFVERENDVKHVAAPQVTEIALSVRADEGIRTVALGKSDGRWRVTSPVNARADAGKVSRLVRGLLELSAADGDAFVADGATDLAPYGLEPWSVEVVLHAKGEDAEEPEKHVVRFGAEPEGKPGVVYAQSSARDTVLLVDGSVVKGALRRDATFFRDPRLVTVYPAGVRSFTLAYGDGRPALAVERRSDQDPGWLLKEPVSGRADAAAVGSVIAAVTGLAAVPGGYVAEAPDDLAPYGLDNPLVTASFDLRPPRGGNGPTAAKFLIGRSPPGDPEVIYAKNAEEPSVLLVPRRTAERLLPEVESLRSKTLLEGFDRWGALEIEIARGEERIHLKRGKGAEWTMVGPAGVEVDYAAPSDFLAAVAELSIRGWPADAPESYVPFGLEEPRASLTIQAREREFGAFGAPPTEGEARAFVIRFGDRTEKGDRCHVRLPSETNVYEVDAGILERIERGVLEFRHHRVLRFDPATVQAFQVEGGRADYAAQRMPHGGWLLTSPVPVLGNETSIGELLAGLGDLTARRLVTSGGWEDPRYGLTAGGNGPFRRVTLRLGGESGPPEAAAVERTLLVGAPAPDGEDGDRYAVVAEDGLVFVLYADAVAALDAELLTAAVTDFPAAAIERIAVTHRDGSRVEAVRKPPTWEIVSHKDVVPNAAAVERLVRAASRIRAEKYVAYNRDGLDAYGLEEPLLTVVLVRQGQLPTELRIGEATDVPSEAADAGAPGTRTMHYATGGGIPAVFLIAEEDVKQLDRHVEDLILMERGT